MNQKAKSKHCYNRLPFIFESAVEELAGTMLSVSLHISADINFLASLRLKKTESSHAQRPSSTSKLGGSSSEDKEA